MHLFFVFRFDPHEWPDSHRKRSNTSREPWKMLETSLENLVGCSVENFWRFCDVFAEWFSDVTIQSFQIPLCSCVLLYRSRIR